MFARLCRRFGRVDVDREESRVKQTKPKGNDGTGHGECGVSSGQCMLSFLSGVCVGVFRWPL